MRSSTSTRRSPFSNLLIPDGDNFRPAAPSASDIVRKSIPILERLRKELDLSEANKTTPDGGFTVETVSCLGACGLAPVITVNEQVYPAMTPEKASELVASLRAQLAAESEGASA